MIEKKKTNLMSNNKRMTKWITETKQVIKKCVLRDLVGWENTQEETEQTHIHTMILNFKNTHIFKQKGLPNKK